ncbi:MAG: GNAT family N-acetyltransferase [Chitinophaga sp.]|uniref:GNAT family N-acetyltransferase n=1 Tax=Chitinophaga sp. TaxID=1869181 RepID=UPI001AFD0111|nr:GNAT family N-acetyltransferase [Chitinophaga sp.]MBO9729422.1 GNAT family N-acetyltransferase [Chitinophaga sp.]
MEIFASTARLILRELIPADAPGMFALDSDPEVHRYLGGHPIKTIEEARESIQFIRQQYKDNGIGRWAVIEKESNEFIGWAGLKFVTTPTNNHVNYYDVGYRFIKDYWGKGYATECTIAALQYGFTRLKPDMIYAWADAANIASNRVLQKTGLTMDGTFYQEGVLVNWFRISREEWVKRY